MKYLLLVVMVSFASLAIEYNPQPLPPLSYFSSVNYNGTITTLASNSWRFETHTNTNCLGSGSMCRKVGVQFDSGPWKRDGFTRISFDFTIEQYPFSNPAEWYIIYQDWVKLFPEEVGGNHPVTTLKVQLVGGKIFLQQYENSWQFDRSNFDPNDPEDTLHNHGLETKRGEIELVVGQTYKIELVVADGHFPRYGHVTLSVDGNVRSDSVYQNASFTESHVSYFGHYWDDESTDPVHKIITRMEDLTLETSY